MKRKSKIESLRNDIKKHILSFFIQKDIKLKELEQLKAFSNLKKNSFSMGEDQEKHRKKILKMFLNKNPKLHLILKSKLLIIGGSLKKSIEEIYNLLFEDTKINLELSNPTKINQLLEEPDLTHLLSLISVLNLSQDDFFSDNKIGIKEVEALALALTGNTKITHLNLSHNQIGIKEVEALAAVLASTKITNLDLSDNKIGIEEAEALALALTGNKTITNLDLSYNEIGIGGKALLLALAGTNITNLNLSDNKIGIEEVEALALALTGNTKITNLDLSYNEIGIGGKALALALAGTNITNLDLSDNNIGIDEVEALALGLTGNKTITNLDLSYNEIGIGGKALLLALAGTNITNLNLSYNNIGIEEVEALALGLKGNKTITNLNLSNNKIGIEEVKALALALAGTNITNLDLSYNNIGIGGKALVLALAGTNITNLDLSYNEIEIEEVEALAGININMCD